jgi:hypothetical protein
MDLNFSLKKLLATLCQADRSSFQSNSIRGRKYDFGGLYEPKTVGNAVFGLGRELMERCLRSADVTSQRKLGKLYSLFWFFSEYGHDSLLDEVITAEDDSSGYVESHLRLVLQGLALDFLEDEDINNLAKQFNFETDLLDLL